MRKLILSAVLSLWAGLALAQGVTVQQLPVDPNAVTAITTLWCGDGNPPHTYQCPALTIAGSILGTNNTWTGSNTFNGAVSLNGSTLGTAATQNVGTSGTNIGMLSTVNTWGAEQILPASTTGSAPLNIPQGTAPTSPVNGDVWTTSTGMFARINGSTTGPFAVSGSGVTSFNTRTGGVTLTSGDVTGALAYTPMDAAGSVTATGQQTFFTSTTGAASFVCPQGVAPTSPSNGQVWCTSSGMFGRFAGSTIGPFGGGSSGVSSFNTRTGAVTLSSADVTTALTFTPLSPANNLSEVASAATSRSNIGAAALASPTFTGTPAGPTATAGTNTTQLATTAFVATSFAPLASPGLTGTPTAPTAAGATNTTQIATTAFVHGTYAPLAPAPRLPAIRLRPRKLRSTTARGSRRPPTPTLPSRRAPVARSDRTAGRQRARPDARPSPDRT